MINQEKIENVHKSLNTQLIIIHTEFNFNKGYFPVKRKEEKYKLNLVKIFEIDDVVFKV